MALTAEYSTTFAYANNLTIVSDALNLHILNFDVQSHAFVTVSPIENCALFCPNCAFERFSSVNPCMCFLRTALPKGIEYSRGETNLNSFIRQVMFSSGIIARLHGTPGHISIRVLCFFSNTENQRRQSK